MTRNRWAGRDRRFAALLAVAAAVTGCGIVEQQSGSAPSTSTAPPAAIGPGPWTLGEVSEAPCRVLSTEEVAAFALDPRKVEETPGRVCTWEAVWQPGRPDGGHFVYFRPDSEARFPGEIRPPDPTGLPETEIEIGGRRAVLTSLPRNDGRNGVCTVQVPVPSGDSFELQVRAGSVSTGVGWDVCARTIEVATAVSAHLR